MDMVRRTIWMPVRMLALGLALAAPAIANGQSDREQFATQLDKFAYRGEGLLEGDAKNLCRCLTGVPTTSPMAGYVTQDVLGADPTRISLRCAVPAFASNGTILGFNYCINWQPL